MSIAANRLPCRAIALGLVWLCPVLSQTSGGPTSVNGHDQSQSTFRAYVDLVSVDVSVRAGNRPVAGLNATDFQLTDNGVPQRVEMFSQGGSPVDGWIVLDASGSMWDGADLDRAAEGIRSGLRRIATLSSQDSRIGLLAFSSTLRELSPLQPAPGLAGSLDGLQARGSMSAHDALTLTMLRPGEATRRRLIIICTDGSRGQVAAVAISSTRLREIAKQFDGVLHVLLVARSSRGLALDRDPTELFPVLAETTGGQLHQVGSVSRIAQTLERIFDDYRRGYVLRYTPQGVTRKGWHDIVVKVTRPGNRFTVRARKGYFGE